jgi:hypothetical protein
MAMCNVTNTILTEGLLRNKKQFLEMMAAPRPFTELQNT